MDEDWRPWLLEINCTPSLYKVRYMLFYGIVGHLYKVGHMFMYGSIGHGQWLGHG